MASCPICNAALRPGETVCSSCGIGSSDKREWKPAGAAAPSVLQSSFPDSAYGSHLQPGSAAPLLSVSDTDADSLHPKLGAFVKELEQWAALNAHDARMDTLRFWSLKLPAIASSAAAGVLAMNHLETVSAVLAAVASACVLIDAVNPGGQLRNAHMRALHDLRTLQHQVMNDWRIGSLKGKNASRLAAEILETAEKSRDRVASELRAAETSFARTVSTK